MEISEKITKLNTKMEECEKLIHDPSINLENALEYANTFKAILSQQIHLNKLQKKGMDYRPDLEYQEGEIVFVNFNRSSPRDFFGGHWAIILKILNPNRLLVVPLTSSTSSRYKMKIEYEIEEQLEKNSYRLKNAKVLTRAEGMLVADWTVPIDPMAIDPNRPKLTLLTPLDEIKRYLIGQLFY